MANKLLLIRWTVGLLTGTLLVWLSSPLLVRSYHAKVFDPIMMSWVYDANTAYRWRNEGYATTVFGPHGMPGRQSLPEPSNERVIALWGDSQAEGVTLADHDKLWATLQRSLATHSQTLDILPFAHSGENAANWIPRFVAVEARLGVDEHFILVCELDDLMPLTQPLGFLPEKQMAGTSDRILDLLPDFVIHAARGLIFEADTLRIRNLRFSPGPITDQQAESSTTAKDPMTFPSTAIAATLAETTEKPITVIYAPRSPLLIGDTIYRGDSRDRDFQSLAVALNQRGIGVVDCRDGLRQAAAQGSLPHGFHNGVFGNGHLNAKGYQVIADAVTATRIQ